jgi:excisionase family DNA binding protein
MPNKSREFPYDRQNFSVIEAAEHLRVSRAFIFKMLRQGKLKASRLGRRRIITSQEIERILAEGHPKGATNKSTADDFEDEVPQADGRR